MALDETVDDLLGKYQLQTAAAGQQMNMGAELVHGSVAAVTDLAVSVWNSLTPEKYSATTEDLLGRIDKDALQVYSEHPDAIHAASFIGGVILPTGLAFKGLNALRAGSKSVNWFSKAGETSRLEAVERAFANSKGYSVARNEAKGAMYKAMAANMLVDNVAAEAALVLTMNAHPYMEDYMDDLGSNFLLYAAIGTGIGGALGTIGVKASIRGVEQPLETAAIQTLSTGTGHVSRGMNVGNQLLVRGQNISNWEATLARHNSKEVPLNTFTEEVLKYTIQSEKAALIKDFQAMSIGALKDAPVDEVNTILGRMKGDLRFGYTDQVSYTTVSGKAIPEVKTGFLPESALNFIKKVTNAKGDTKVASNKAVYLPEHDAFVSLKEADDYLPLANSGETLKTLSKVEPDFGKLPRSDKLLEAEILSTPELEADFAKALATLLVKNVDELNKLKVNPDDLPMMKGIIAKLADMPPEEAAKVTGMLFTREAPTWGMQQKAAIKSAGFSKKYLTDLAEIDKNRKQFHIYDNRTERALSDFSEGAATGIRTWVRGHTQHLRSAALLKLHPQLRVETSADLTRAKMALDEMLNHNNTRAFKAALTPLMDAEGNVLLYRGMNNAPRGHQAIESYSLNPGKAAAFGQNRLYKVHVDDIVGSLEDLGPTGKNISNSEILVLNRATRENAIVTHESAAPSKFFSSEGELVIPEAVTSAGVVESNLPAIIQSVRETEAKLVATLRNAGYKDESIALRVGMSQENFNSAYVIGGNGAGAGMPKFTTLADIEMALNPANKALTLATNLNKVHFAEMRGRLSAKSLDTMNADIIEMIIHGSSDPIVRGVGELVGSRDSKILLQNLLGNLDEVTVSGLRSTMFRSANTAVESFGIAGTIATRIGQDVTHYVNATTEKLVKPIANAALVISRSPALIAETNMAVAVNASIAGKRAYKNRQFITFVKNLETGEIEEVAAKYMGKEFTVASDEVDTLFKAMEVAGRSMYALNNTSNKVLGKAPLSDIGFWIPAFNPRNKELAYVIAPEGTSILWARTSAELNDKVLAYERTAKLEGRNVQVVTKDKGQEHYNKLVGREDPMYMQMADVSMQHTGSSTPALLPTNMEMLTDIINSYDHLVSNGVTKLVDIQLSPVMDRLQRISELSQMGHNPAAMGAVQKGTKAQKDPGMVMRNILLGKGQLSQHASWSDWQQKMQVGTDIALEQLSKLTTPVFQKIGTTADRNPETWIQLNKELADKGLTPFKAVDDYQRYLAEGRVVSENLTPRAVALSNAVAATTLLKFLELAQPFVNMISLPILTSGAMRKQMAQNFMGAEKAALPAHYGVTAHMFDSVRFMNSAEGMRVMKLGEDRNLFASIVSEANEAMRHAKSLDPGLISKGETIIKSQFVENASFASNWSESMVRRMSFANGWYLAKKMYPGLDDVGNMTFARSFMDEAIGNYSSAQRPALFQGTFGVAMGLFQTYMLTLAQQLYRGIERKDWIGLSKQMLTQTSIFGASSLPGFHLVSEQIGAHLSDDHVDLTSGTFRAIGDDNATTLLYGLPSLLGVGATTRGDIQPRIPNPIQGLDSLAAVNLTKQVWKASTDLASAAIQADADTGKAFMQALSVQSISRPVARLSELVTGESITGAGHLVADNAEVYTTQGILARVMATRPIEEIKARQAMHLDSTYKSVEGEARRKVIKQLRTHISNGDLDAAKVQRLQYEYLRTGAPSGWRQAVNEAMLERVKGGDRSVKDRLRPDAPYQRMIDDLD